MRDLLHLCEVVGKNENRNMFNKNLLERLRILTTCLVDAEARDDLEEVESLQEQIWELQDIIDEESEIEYEDHHNKSWR